MLVELCAMTAFGFAFVIPLELGFVRLILRMKLIHERIDVIESGEFGGVFFHGRDRDLVGYERVEGQLFLDDYTH